MDSIKKERKESFIGSNNTGTVEWELFQILGVCPLSYLFYSQLWRRFPNIFSESSALQKLSAEFVTLVLPNVFACTMTDYNWCLIGAMSTVSLLCYTSSSRREGVKSHRKGAAPRKFFVPSLSIYRFFVQVLTCVSILAVDFYVFPRRHAKTEGFGISLMDLGVGIVMLSSGLVAGVAKDAVKPSLRRTVPPLILGALRFTLVKVANYQEHVTEYGTHWNFFLTIALVPSVVAILDWSRIVVFGRYLGRQTFSLLFAGTYEVALHHGLSNYVISAKRDSFLSHNREGLLSLFGYSVIFMLGFDVGQQMRSQSPKSRIAVLLKCSALLYCLDRALHLMLNLEKSRRLLNLPYILFTASSSLAYVAALEASLLLLPVTPKSVLVDVSTRHQLSMFLLANVAVGLLNFFTDTLSFGDVGALAVIVSYMYALYLGSCFIFGVGFKGGR